jgi:hypothetical protein
MELALKDFVKESLLQIIEGVVDAQTEVDKLRAKINPTNISFYSRSTPTTKVVEDGNIPQMIEFDIGVTISDKKATEGKVGIALVIVRLDLSAGGRSSSENIVVNRIKFQVPILFPGQPVEDKMPSPTILTAGDRTF